MRLLWSPPYFDLERYSDELTQSWVKFPDREGWLNGYMGATLANVFAALKPGGTLALNVSAEMKVDAALAAGEGFALVREMRYALSRMIGSKHQGEGPKSEPLLIFTKENIRQ